MNQVWHHEVLFIILFTVAYASKQMGNVIVRALFPILRMKINTCTRVRYIWWFIYMRVYVQRFF